MLKDIYAKAGLSRIVVNGAFVSEGRLMSPDEVSQAIANREPEDMVPDGVRWTLCGDMHEAMFQQVLLDPEPLNRWQVGVLKAPTGSSYLVLTHQVGGHQHRFILPLWDSGVMRFMESMEADDSRNSFLFGRQGGIEAVVTAGRIDEESLQSFKQHGGLPRDAYQEMTWQHEFTWITFALTVPEAVPSLVDGEVVRGVSVSLIAPSELQQAQPASPTRH